MSVDRESSDEASVSHVEDEELDGDIQSLTIDTATLANNPRRHMMHCEDYTAKEYNIKGHVLENTVIVCF